MARQIPIIIFLLLLLSATTAAGQTYLDTPFSYCPGQDPTLLIQFEIQQAGPVQLKVLHTFTESPVRTVVDGVLAAGQHQVAWDGNNELGQPVETGVYIVRLTGDGWQTENWIEISCGFDLAITEQLQVDGHDLQLSITGMVDPAVSTELAIYTGDGTTRVVEFPTYGGPTNFFSWICEDSLRQTVPAGAYILRMTSSRYSEDLPFDLDPAVRGALSLTVTDANSDVITGISASGTPPLAIGPMQEIAIGFGRAMSAAEITYLLDGGLKFSQALGAMVPSLPVVWPDSSGVTFTAFAPNRDWPDIWGSGSVVCQGLFAPDQSRVRVGFSHQGITWQDRFCNSTGPVDAADWVLQPGPFYSTVNGTMTPACNNPVLVGQTAQFELDLETVGWNAFLIIDAEGNRVRNLSRELNVGWQIITWDRLDDSGSEVPAGYYRLLWQANPINTRDIMAAGDIYVSSAAADVAGPGALPDRPVLLGNHPNPFNPMTSIRFALPQAGFARVTVLALDGREVAILLADEMTAGSHEVFWNGQDDQGRRVASGAYFYRLEAGGVAETGRMLLLK